MKIQTAIRLIGLAIVILANSLMMIAGELNGSIKDAETGSGLPGATLRVLGTEIGVTADPLGRFELLGLESGTYTLEVRYLGYTSMNVIATLDDAGDSETITIQLQPVPLMLPEVDIQDAVKQNINLLSAVDWQMRAASNGQDMLRFVPGMVIAQHAGGGKAEQMFIRGFDLDHGTDIQISVDGMPVNMVSHAHGQGYADAHFIIPETVQDIQYEMGLGEVRNGNLATAGAVTFNLLPSIDQTLIQAEAGSFNNYRALALINLLSEKMRGNGHTAYAGGSFRYADGPFNPAQGMKAFNGIAKYRAISKSGSVLELTGMAFENDWRAAGLIAPRAVETGLVDRFGRLDSAEGGNTSRYNAALSWTQPLNRGILDAEVSYGHYTFDLVSNFTYYLENPEVGDRIRQTEIRNLGNGKLRWRNQWMWLGRPAPFEIAVGGRTDFVDDLALGFIASSELAASPTMSGIGREYNGWSYVSQSFNPFENLRVEFGTRADFLEFWYRNDNMGGEIRSKSRLIISPKLKADFTINESAAVFLKAGKGFHSNDLRVLIQDEGVDPVAPAYGIDLGGRFKPADGLLFQITGWWLYSSNELVYVGDGGLVEAGDPSTRTGIDLSVRANLVKNLTADIDGNISRARTVGASDGENLVPLSAWFTTGGGLNYKHPKGFGASLRYRAIADRPADETGAFTAEGFFLLDGSVRYDTNRWSVWCRGENLLNREWREAQFLTTSRLATELAPVDEVHFTPGFPISVLAGVSVKL